MLDLTASIVSHGHCDEVLGVIEQLALLAPSAPRRVMLTVNRPEPTLGERLHRSVFPFELVVIDNFQPAGFGANHNAAFERDRVLGASAAFVVLNPDLRWADNPFIVLMNGLAGDPGIGAVYPLQVDCAGVPQDAERLLPTPLRLLTRYLRGRRHEVGDGAPPDWVNAACLMLRREAYAQVRGFDERYHMYCEDVDLCLRLQLSGWRLSRVKTVVEHAGQRASHRSLNHLVWHVSSLMRLWRSAAYSAFKRLHA